MWKPILRRVLYSERTHVRSCSTSTLWKAGPNFQANNTLSPAYLANSQNLRTAFQVGASSLTAASPPVAASVSHFATDEALGDKTSTASGAKVPDMHLEALQSQELYRAAKLARLSGLCYLQGAEEQDLERRVAEENMRLVACGNTYFTRWFIADEDEDLHDAASSQEADTLNSAPSTTQASGAPQVVDGTQRASLAHRIVVMRGVVWRGDAVEPLRLWQALAKVWPIPLAPEATHPQGAVLAHSVVQVPRGTGAAGMAEDLFEQLKEYLSPDQAGNPTRHITFAGHSMGGSLALLMACLARLRAAVPPSTLRCYTFGSPPTLSSAQGYDGDRVLEVLGVPRRSVKNFVLDNDPVPRAMLSVDPSFTILKKVGPLRGLLEFREWWLGQGASFTPNRFLYDTVGELHYVRWSPEEGHQVVPLDRTSASQQLEMAIGELMRQPVAALAAVLDHAHSSYAHDLQSAARVLERRQGRRESLV